MKKILLVILLAIGVYSSSSATTFTSTQNGNWSNPATWGGAGVPDANDDAIVAGHTIAIDVSPSAALNTLTINSGSSVTLNTGISIAFADFAFADVFILNSGATFTNNGTFNVPTLSNVQIYGTFNSSSDLVNDDPSSLFFNSGSNYVHKYTTTRGNIPNATWDPASTVTISGYTSSTQGPLNLNQAFGNFVWNCTGQTTLINLVLSGSNFTIGGSLTIQSTNGRGILFSSSASYTLLISKDFLIQSGNIVLNSSSSHAIVNVQQNFSMSGGTLTLISGSNGTTDLNIAGNFTNTSGSISRAGTNTTANITFNGTGVQTYSYSGTAIATSVNYIVATGSSLDLKTSALTGSGNFTLSSSATLYVGSTDQNGAIQLGNNGSGGGNIKVTGTRSYANDATATIVFNGTSLQNLGNGYPNLQINLTINNPTNVSIAGYGATINANSTLTLTQGNLIIGSNTLIVYGNISTGAGALTTGSGSVVTINGSGALGTLPFDAASTILGTLTVNRSASGSVTLGKDMTINSLTLTNGTLIINGRTLTLGGTITAGGTGTISGDASTSVIIPEFSSNLGTLNFTTGSNTISTLTLDRSTGATLGTNLTVSNLNLVNGALAQSGGTLSIASGGTITRTSGSIATAPTAATTYNVTYLAANTTGSELPISSTALNNLTINTTSGSVVLGASTTVNGNVVITTGTFDTGANTLTVKSGFTNNSTFTSSGTVVFSGTSAQTIGGSSITSFNNLTINNSAGVSFTGSSSTYTIAGTLTLTSGALSIGSNTLVLNSTISSTGGSMVGGFSSNLSLTGTGSGTLPAISGGLGNLTLDRTGYTVTVGSSLDVNGALTLTNGTLASGGNLNLNLNLGYVPGTGSGSISGNMKVTKSCNALQYIANPLSTTTAAQLDDNVSISPGNVLYYYDETNPSQDQQYGWTAITSTSTPLTQGQGYAIYLNSAGPVDIISTYDHTLSPTVTGTNTSSGNASADGWNLFGNPFPATSNWDNLTKSNVDDAIYFRNSNSTFKSYVGGVGVNGGNQYIPSMQSFWVRVSSPGTGSVTFPKTARENYALPSYRLSAPSNLLRLTATLNGISDETVIYFDSTATFGFDNSKDAYKLTNSGNAPNIYTTLEGQDLAINSIPSIKDSLEIPLKLYSSNGGLYTISASDLTSFGPQVGSIYLLDKKLNIQQDLMVTPQYEATVTSTDFNNRFYIKFTNNTITGTTGAENDRFYLFNTDNVISARFENIEVSNANISISNLQGREVYKLDNATISSGSVSFNTGLENGLYLVRITTPGKTFVKKIYLNK